MRAVSRILTLGFLLTAAVTQVPGTSRAAFPGVNGQIAFAASRDGGYEIYKMNSNGSSQTRVTNDPSIDGDPNWNAAGDLIVFDSTRTGHTEIFTVTADGATTTQITHMSSTLSYPAFSPTGGKIVFAKLSGGTNKLFVINTDGSHLHKITSGDDTTPDWSPDGKHIVFRRLGNSGGLFTVSPNGTNLERVTRNYYGDYFPSWSPLGTRIAFVHNRPSSSPLETIKPNGKGVQTIAYTGIDHLSEPVWSPDATMIAGINFDGSDYEIWAVPVAGGAAVQLTNNTSNDILPNWGPA